MLYCFISLSSGAKAAFVSYIQLVVATEQSGIASVCKPLAVQAIQGLSKDHNDSVRHHTLWTGTTCDGQNWLAFHMQVSCRRVWSTMHLGVGGQTGSVQIWSTLSARSATGCVVHGLGYLPTTSPTRDDETRRIDGSVHVILLDECIRGTDVLVLAQQCPAGSRSRDLTIANPLLYR